MTAAAPASGISAADFRMVALARRLAPLLRMLGETEGDFRAARLDARPIDRPVFVAGLARSGTTILLTLLAAAGGVATHRYRDFPFLDIPLLWNWFQDRAARPAPPAERAHGDRIRVTPQSPEAFEEPLWQAFFPDAHHPDRSHLLDAGTRAPAFEAYFRRHIRKILYLRDGSRYLSKGNYNIARIRYLARVFPDARFVLPVRAPRAHVRSLVRQHARFSAMAAGDPRVGAWMAAAGHYEFGPQRRPLVIAEGDGAAIRAGWAEDEHLGYARQWAAVYAHVAGLRDDPALAGRLAVLRYETLCADPAGTVADLLALTGLEDPQGRVAAAAATVAAPEDDGAGPSPAQAALVRAAVAGVAERFGYGPED